MAGEEILVLETRPRRDGSKVYGLLFFYAVNPKIQVNGQDLVLTKSTELPPLVIDHGMLAQPEINALDTGAAFFEGPEPFTQHRGESDASALKRLRAKYAARAARIVNEKRDQYARTGRYSAT